MPLSQRGRGSSRPYENGYVLGRENDRDDDELPYENHKRSLLTSKAQY